MADKSVFETLSKINVNGKTEKKNGLTYLSWAFAWGEVKKAFPKANYTIYENADGWNYFTDRRTCWVKVGVTIEEQEHIEYLPVMDYRNNSIPFDKVTSFDVNKAIQRALTKAVARHGLGLYIYAGEDLPEELLKAEPPKAQSGNSAPNSASPVKKYKCADCGNEITDYQGQPAEKIARATHQKYGKPICMACSAKRRAEAEAKAEAEAIKNAADQNDGELPFEIV